MVGNKLGIVDVVNVSYSCLIYTLFKLFLIMLHVYSRLNHVGVCMSYTATLSLLDEISTLHTCPLQKWIAENDLFKFWGDNIDKKRGVRDVRTDHHGSLLHMYSILAGRSRVQVKQLSCTGCVAPLCHLTADSFLPTTEDFAAVKKNLVVVGRIITKYISGLSGFSKAFPPHILHKYSKE